MHQIEFLTIRNGWVILMSPTRKGLCILFMRFISSDSLANGDEPDESDMSQDSDTNSYNTQIGQSAIG